MHDDDEEIDPAVRLAEDDARARRIWLLGAVEDAALELLQ